MSQRHLAFWPKNVPRELQIPETSLFYNAEVSATRYPNKPYLIYYDSKVTFGQFRDEAERVAGFLERECGVKKGDRVLLFMQNSPQFVLSYYGILRANAVIVPINPMNLTNELKHYVSDSGAKTAIVSQELYPQIKPLIGQG
ncbi:MAG: AMP-binding protein, partial [Sulfurifustis sp.]